jgi:hypothetical protein
MRPVADLIDEFSGALSEMPVWADVRF